MRRRAMADAHVALRRLPADVADLNAIASGAGIEVTVSEAKDEGVRYRNGVACASGEMICVRWRGTEAQLRATGLIKRSCHLPVRRGQLWPPHDEAHWFIDDVGRSFLHGDVAGV